MSILLAGGNDSFNMLVPNDADQFAEYANLRSDLALDQSTLLPIASIADGPNAGRNYALHPAIPELQTLYGDGELALIANVGTLLEPVDAAGVESGSARLPLGLYSHADQIQQWQTAVPDARVAHGWGGRIADLLHSQGRSPANGVAMNISLSGNNVFQSGRRTNAYSIHHEYGAPGIYAYDTDTDYGPFRKQMIDDLLDVEHGNLLRREYSRRLRGAIDNQRVYSEAIATAPDLTTGFSDTPFSQSCIKSHASSARATPLAPPGRPSSSRSAAGTTTTKSSTIRRGCCPGSAPDCGNSAMRWRKSARSTGSRRSPPRISRAR